MNILLTNDDGIHAPGLRHLRAALMRAGHQVRVVAPLTEQSAVGHAITVAMPVKVKEITEETFAGLAVQGTPVDCVKLALTVLCPAWPDVVISGINAGANVGIDVLYSGTVSAATEGSLAGLPALAVSMDSFVRIDLAEQADYTAGLITEVEWPLLPPHCILNLNFPDRPMSESLGLKLCPQTTAVYEDGYERNMSPHGQPYYWLTGDIPPERLAPDCDRALLTRGHITLTPLRFDLTDHDTLNRLRHSLGEH